MQEKKYDLTIRNGRVSTATDTFYADIGVHDGKVAAISHKLAPGLRDIDADGRWVLPGGIDSHCHIEQLSGALMIFTRAQYQRYLVPLPPLSLLPPSTEATRFQRY